MKKGRLSCRPVVQPAHSGYSSEWLTKKWDALPHEHNRTVFDAYDLWADGDTLYYSSNPITVSGVTYPVQFVLNGDRWEKQIWSGVPTVFTASNIWTDGTDVYYSYYSNQLVLKDGVWIEKNWEGVTLKSGSGIWSDGENIYYSWNDEHYVLVNGMWEPKTWSYSVRPRAGRIWSDGKSVYCTYDNVTQLLAGDTWEEKIWDGFSPESGDYIWSDGSNVYYSRTTTSTNYSQQYALIEGVWQPKTWNGLPEDASFVGANVWSDSRGIYLGSDYILAEDSTDHNALTQGWIVGKRLAAQRGRA